jgi:hypothetical protein
MILHPQVEIIQRMNNFFNGFKLTDTKFICLIGFT